MSDRSFLLGDAVFETLRVYHGVPFAWDRHLERLRRGAALLGILAPDSAELREQSRELIRRHGCEDAVLRIHLSRGSGPRGYAPGTAGPPLSLISLSPAPLVGPDRPRSVRVVTSSFRVSVGAMLTDCKSANRLPQVLALAEAERLGAEEALMLNTRDEVAEAGSANFFWFGDGFLATPPLESGALNGITRALILEIAKDWGLPLRESVLRHSECDRIQAAFLTSSVQEIQRVSSLDQRELQVEPVVDRLHAAYAERVEMETRYGMR